jgi:hypothetical protein
VELFIDERPGDMACELTETVDRLLDLISHPEVCRDPTTASPLSEPTAATVVRLNPRTKGYHRGSCKWLANGRHTDLAKYVDMGVADLPEGAKPCTHSAPPVPPRPSD